jgi:CheY-like chemotaxis protein
MAVRILVASDDKRIGDMLRDKLSMLDCELLLAREISLALYLAHKNLPDVILCDTTLTDKDGMDYLSEIKSDADLAPIPFFFLANENGETDLRQKAQAAGALDVISSDSSGAILDRLLPYLQERKVEREPQTPE